MKIWNCFSPEIVKIGLASGACALSRALRARQVLFEFLRKILSKILTKILEIELESGASAPSRRALRARQDFNFFPINFENWARIGRYARDRFLLNSFVKSLAKSLLKSLVKSSVKSFVKPLVKPCVTPCVKFLTSGPSPNPLFFQKKTINVQTYKGNPCKNNPNKKKSPFRFMNESKVNLLKC